MWSCLKSGVGKVLRGSHREKSSGRLDQRDGQASGSAVPARPPLVLLGTDWLEDQHIAADYRIRERELHRNNPDLAARTRFVWPAQALVLRLAGDEDTLRGIVNDEDGNDTADFLFLPINNARPDCRGDHWSLLFVDRSNRESPIAYHYDSYKNHNATSAAQLSDRLHASLERPRMKQQKNSYDCGVFMLDATRKLVDRLEQTQQIDAELLNLDELVADRKALKHRLRKIPL
ncbi:hypothetical protein ACVWW6_009015 [Bradyrhizobium sp. USDA 3311]